MGKNRKMTKIVKFIEKTGQADDKKCVYSVAEEGARNSIFSFFHILKKFSISNTIQFYYLYKKGEYVTTYGMAYKIIRKNLRVKFEFWMELKTLKRLFSLSIRDSWRIRDFLKSHSQCESNMIEKRNTKMLSQKSLDNIVPQVAHLVKRGLRGQL